MVPYYKPSPGYRATHTMDETGPSGDSPPYLVGPNSKQITPTEGRQDTNPGIPLTQLNANINDSVLTVSVDSVAQFTVDDIIEIDNERMEITAIDVSANDFTVAREVEGTDNASHLDNAWVFLFVRWQLQVDRISHGFQTPAIPLPLPTRGQGDQVLNKMIDIGMRNESIRCSGVLRDVGVPSMRNVRKQTLLDLARVQFSPTIGLSGDESGPSNPNAYMRLVIGSGHEPSDYTDSIGGSVSNPLLKINTNLITRDLNNNENGGTAAAGNRRTSKGYRGLITDLNLELEGGRPDIWRFNFTFYVVKNEHDYVTQ